MSQSEVLLALWRDRLAAIDLFDGSPGEWCVQNNINPRQYYRWRAKVNGTYKAKRSTKPAIPTKPPLFVPITLDICPPASAPSSLTVKIAGAEIEIHEGFNHQLLRSFSGLAVARTRRRKTSS